MSHQYCTTACGASIMPTETKNMAPNRSLMGDVSRSMCSLSTVSARMEPIMNAPRADEKPEPVASATMPKHRPRLTMSRISSFRYFLVFLSMVGMR